MDYEEWQLKRRMLQERERAERSINWQQSRAPIQAAITEQAVRELYDMCYALDEKLAAFGAGVRDGVTELVTVAKRGPGRPPKEAE